MTIGKIGRELKKAKTWKRAFKKSGNILQTGGYATIAVGTATGQPEVVALGGSAVGVGKVYTGIARGIKFVDNGNLHEGMKELDATFE